MTLIILLAVLGIACIGYYIAMVSYAGFGTAFSKEWLAMAAVFIIAAFILFMLHKHDVKVRTWIKVTVGTIVGIGLAVFLVIEGMIVAAMNQPVQDNLDYVIVLGAQVRGTRITRSLKMRLDRTYDYLLDNDNTIAIMSGGQGTGEDKPEAECMKDYLVDRGIDQSRIIVEDKSTNTDENIEFSMAIIGDDSAKVGVITNNFHVYRAVKICKRQGYEVNGISARTGNCLFVNYMFREFFAVVKYKLSGQI